MGMNALMNLYTMPFVNRKNNFVFVHVPKCGGRSIKRVFDIKNHDHAGIQNLNIENKNSDLFKFAFVRNPWDRFVSAFEYIKRGGIPKLDSYCTRSYLMKQKPTFKNFIKAEHTWSRWVFFFPQVNFISINGSIALDFVGRFENLQNDFDYVCDQINHGRIKLPHINKTKHPHYTEYYDDESIEFVSQYFADDIKAFDYKFEDRFGE